MPGRDHLRGLIGGPEDCAGTTSRCVGTGIAFTYVPGDARPSTLTRFRIEDCRSAGIDVSPSTTLIASDGVVRGSPRGLVFGGVGDRRDAFRRVRFDVPTPVLDYR